MAVPANAQTHRRRWPLSSTATVILAIFLALVVWELMSVLLLVFAGILLAVLLRAPTDWIAGHSPLSDRWAYGLVVLLLLLIVAGLGWYMWPRMVDEIAQLSQVFLDQLQRAEELLQEYAWGRWLITSFNSMVADGIPTSSSRRLLERALGVFTGAFGLLVDAVIVLAIGLYLASQPRLYSRGLLRLLPKDKRTEAAEVLGATGRALRLWLLARVFEMVVLGTAIGIGLFFLDVPLALILAVIAGLFEFIPLIGGWLGAVPAVIVAANVGPQTVLWVIVLFLVVQMVESYILTPIVEERMVTTPPVLAFTVQIILGVLVGALGVALAWPLTLVGIVLVKALYVEGVLGDRVELPGEDEEDAIERRATIQEAEPPTATQPGARREVEPHSHADGPELRRRQTRRRDS